MIDLANLTNDFSIAEEELPSLPPMIEVPEQPEGIRAVASVFANPLDLQRYQEAITNGASEREALSVGDNGVGKWGDDTTSFNIPMVALPEDTPGLKHGRLVLVNGPHGRVIAKVGDIMPARSRLQGRADIDLNPAAAYLTGHSGGVTPVTWKWADEAPGHDLVTANTPDPLALKRKGLQGARFIDDVSESNPSLASAEILSDSIPEINPETTNGSEPMLDIDQAVVDRMQEPAPLVPSMAGVKAVAKNPDGTYQLSNKAVYDKTRGTITFDYHGQKWVSRGPGTTLFKLPATQTEKTQGNIADEAFAKKGGTRKDYPSEDDYLKARKSALSTERKSLTEMQIKGAAYYQRASDAAQRAEEVLKKYNPESFQMDADLLLRDTPIARRMVSDNSKRLFPIIEEFTNAVLRRDSGAAVTNIEMKRALERYFPVPGDTSEAVAEKARNRQVTMDSLKTGVPEGTIRSVEPMATPSSAATPSTVSTHPVITSQEKYDALLPGEIYSDKNGGFHQKPR